MITVENAIPVQVPDQLELRDFLKERFPDDSDIMRGMRLGTFYCHYGELLKRRDNDPDVSDAVISNEEFEAKMSNLLRDIPNDVREFVHI